MTNEEKTHLASSIHAELEKSLKPNMNTMLPEEITISFRVDPNDLNQTIRNATSSFIQSIEELRSAE